MSHGAVVSTKGAVVVPGCVPKAALSSSADGAQIHDAEGVDDV